MSVRLLFVGKLLANGKTIIYLQDRGFDVTRTEGLRPTLRALAETTFDLAILDANDISAINIHRISHKVMHLENAPFILVMTGNHSGLSAEIAHDEYIVRPFTNRQVEKQVRHLLASRSRYVVTLGPLALDRRTQRVRTPKGVERLTPKQFALLDYLFEHAGKLVTRRQLMQAIWQTDYLGDTRTLDVHVRWLRERIEADADHPQLLRTHRGRGYSLDIEGPLQVGGDPIL